MQFAIDFVIGLADIYAVGDFIVGYANATGTFWDRALTAGKGSATILWQRLVIFTSGLSALLVELATYFNVPQIDSAIQAVLKPQYIGFFTIAVAVVTEFARRRTLTPPPTPGA